MLPCPALSSGSPRHAPRAQAKGLFIAVSEEKEAGNRKLERRGREQAVKGPTDPTDLESLPGTVGGRNSVHTLPPQCPTCCPLPALCLFLHVLVKVLSEGHSPGTQYTETGWQEAYPQGVVSKHPTFPLCPPHLLHSFLYRGLKTSHYLPQG